MYRVSVDRDRPDFRVFIDLLYHAERNVDTEGNSNPVNSRTWTYLYIEDRESDDPSIEIGLSEEDSGTFEVTSKSQELATLAALYLFLYCGTSISRDDHTLDQQEVGELRARYVSQLERAERAVWHQSSDEVPYPNLRLANGGAIDQFMPTAPETLQSSYHLIRGDTVLGTIDHDAAQDNFPWYGGVFEPTPEFENIRPLFDDELRLLNAHQMEEWDIVWNEIEKPGLRLEPLHAGSPVTDVLIHIDGATTWWRS